MQNNSGDWPRTMCRVAVAVIVVCGAVALPAIANDDQQTRAIGASLEERIAAGDLQYRDSRTGEVVVATAERVADIRESLAPQFAPVSGVHQYVKDDGTIQVTAEQTFNDVFLSRVNLDGTRTRGCFRDLDSAVAFIVGLDTEMQKTMDPARVAVVD